MAVQIAGLGDVALWAELARLGGVPSHGHGHAAALARAGITPQLAAIRTPEGGAVLPFHERRWSGTTDVCSWLTVTGARLWGDPGPALALWQAHARARGWVASYIQVEPFSLPTALARPGEVWRGPVSPGAVSSSPASYDPASSDPACSGPAWPEALDPGPEVLVLDLAGPPPPLPRSLARTLRRAEALNPVLEDDPERLAVAFAALYPAAMRRRGAGPAYALPAEALRALVTAPGTLALGAVLEGRVQAVVVMPCTAHRAEGFLSADTESARPLSAWLYARIVARLRARGIRHFDLGGGIRGRDGVFAFKARFGAGVHRLGALRLIHDAPRYAALCTAAGLPAEIPPGPGWFPAYRAPR